MRKFPTKLLVPSAARLSGPAEAASIEIKLEKFSLDHMDDPVETAVRLECIELPTMSPHELAGETFNFPTNPEPGYVDGSIYIEHAHHPADVISMRFGSCSGDQIEVEIVMNLAFDFEGLEDFTATEWTCRTKLSVGSVH